jgi:hypothetical protein
MRNRYQLTLSLAVYGVCCTLLYPFYRHVFDFDGVGYFAVTKQLAAGNWYNAINGYWSPLHSWLALPLYKAGMNEFDAFRVVCILAGGGILLVTYRLLNKAAPDARIRLTVLLTAIPIVLCYVFCYQAADILCCLLLLVYIDVITAHDLFENRYRNSIAGVVACLTYFAKAYAFPFFLVHFTVLQWLLYRQSAAEQRRRWLWRNLRWGIGIFLLMALPWLAALFYKYRMVTFGYSGKLNLQWVLQGFGLETRTLYALNPFPMDMHWKDPWSYPWNFNSPSSFDWQKPVEVFFKNLRQFFTLLPFFTFLGAAIIPIMGVYAYKKKNVMILKLFLVAAIFPAGYLLVALEIRYLFVLSFVLLTAGTMLMPKKIPVLAWVLFFGSFLLFPIHSLIASVNKGRSYFTIARQLQHAKGKWITDNFQAYTELTRVAYLTGATLYQFPRAPRHDAEITTACRQAGINYYFHYCQSALEAASFRQTALYRTALQEIKTSDQNIVIIKLQ